MEVFFLLIFSVALLSIGHLCMYEYHIYASPPTISFKFPAFSWVLMSLFVASADGMNQQLLSQM
jgi:hypothetical protein